MNFDQLVQLREDPEGRTKALREALDRANKKASDAYSDFNRAKEEAEKSGKNLLTDDEAFRPLQALHKAFEEEQAAAEKARKTYMEHLEGLASDGIGTGGHKGSKSPVAGAWPTNVSDSFLKAFATEEGQKALVSGSGAGAYVAPFFDSRIRALPQRRLFVRSLIPDVPHESDFVLVPPRECVHVECGPGRPRRSQADLGGHGRAGRGGRKDDRDPQRAGR